MYLIHSTPFHKNIVQPNYIKEYINQELPCQYRFKSGKVIYGIVLKRYDEAVDKFECFFISVAENLSKHELYSKIDYCKKHAYIINTEDLIYAEELKLAA